MSRMTGGIRFTSNDLASDPRSRSSCAPRNAFRSRPPPNGLPASAERRRQSDQRNPAAGAGICDAGSDHPLHSDAAGNRLRVSCRSFLSSLLSLVPVAVLWFLDRREREAPWLFVAAFLWGGLHCHCVALPFNTAFFKFVDGWVAQHPILTEILGPDAALMLAAPISAPITEELAKALGVLLLFWLLRAEFDNMRDGLVYGALVGSDSNG